MSKKLLLITLVVALLTVGYWFSAKFKKSEKSENFVNDQKNEKMVKGILSFEDCVSAGNPIIESYPRQCRHGEMVYMEDVSNEVEKQNLIRLDYPRQNSIITSPLVIRGEARGNWFFEASFPVILTNWDGLIIAEGIAQAQGDWMTTDFVPFEAVLEFPNPTYKDNGSLILKKDNPSGLPEHDDALEITVFFKETD